MVSACPAASNAARTRSTDPPVSDPDMLALVALPRPYAKHRKRSPKQNDRRWLGHRQYRAEQSVLLAIDAVSEVQRGRRAAAGAIAEAQRPQAARRVAAADIDRDR